eukprot:s2836_g16.t1
MVNSKRRLRLLAFLSALVWLGSLPASSFVPQPPGPELQVAIPVCDQYDMPLVCSVWDMSLRLPCQACPHTGIYILGRLASAHLKGFTHGSPGSFVPILAAFLKDWITSLGMREPRMAWLQQHGFCANRLKQEEHDEKPKLLSVPCRTHVFQSRNAACLLGKKVRDRFDDNL